MSLVKRKIGDTKRYQSDKNGPEGSKYPKLAISLHRDPNLLNKDRGSIG
ncbi:MAG TPA: hypothetical protein VJ729_03500 [Nitrososphaeraceae archaeon]|jgi:hypothetical protein|nr:hypothetical protein [Nitrososphaeraceae archaeon]